MAWSSPRSESGRPRSMRACSGTLRSRVGTSHVRATASLARRGRLHRTFLRSWPVDHQGHQALHRRKSARRVQSCTGQRRAFHRNTYKRFRSGNVGGRRRSESGRLVVLAVCYNDPANAAVEKIVAVVNPSGLAFCLLGPVQSRRMSFDIIRKLSKEGRHAHSCQRAGPSAES